LKSSDVVFDNEIKPPHEKLLEGLLSSANTIWPIYMWFKILVKLKATPLILYPFVRNLMAHTLPTAVTQAKWPKKA